MSEAEFTGSEIVDAPDAQVDDSFTSPPRTELDDEFAEIVEAQNRIDAIELELGNPLSPKITEKHGAGFITQGAVGWVDFQVRDGFGTPAEAQANKQLEQLIKAIATERRSKLFVRVGNTAVLPFIIDPIKPIDPHKPELVAEPFDKKHHLQQGSVIELDSIYENMTTHHGAYHDREPQSYAGKYTTFLPIAWIGRILRQEGELILKPRD